MGLSVHDTCVKHAEGRRDEIHNAKTNWSAAQCGDDQRRPADTNRRRW